MMRLRPGAGRGCRQSSPVKDDARCKVESILWNGRVVVGGQPWCVVEVALVGLGRRSVGSGRTRSDTVRRIACSLHWGWRLWMSHVLEQVVHGDCFTGIDVQCS